MNHMGIEEIRVQAGEQKCQGPALGFLLGSVREMRKGQCGHSHISTRENGN